MKKGWVEKRLGDVCTLKSGTTVSKSCEKAFGALPYVKVADMSYPGNESEIVSSSRFLDKKDIKKNAVFPIGTTIFPKRGGAILTNKKRLTLVPICTDLNIMGIIPSVLLTPKFVFYYFIKLDLGKLGSGSSIPQINNYDIAPLIIPLPPLPEQKRIVEILDEAFAAIDKATANTEKNIKNAEELFESLLEREIVNCRGISRNLRLGSIVSRLTNGYVGPTRGIYKDDGIPYLLARHVKNNNLRFDRKTYVSNEFNQKHKKSMLKEGDVLLVQSGHIGHSAVVPKKHDGHNCHAMIVLSTCPDILSGKYLSFCFNSKSFKTTFQSIRSGSTVPHLTCRAVKELTIPVPSLKEQMQVLNRFAEKSPCLTLLQEQNQSKLLLLKGVKQSMLHKAFTGELTSDFKAVDKALSEAGV